MGWSAEWVKDKKSCSVIDCNDVHYAKGWCKIHYNRMKRNGHLQQYKVTNFKCAVPECSNVGSIVGLCKKHYDQKRHQDKPLSAKANHAHHIKYRYGITIEDYNDKLTAQNHCCAICKQPEDVIVNSKVIRLAVDHCHNSKQVRDLLCIRCNRVLGSVKDNPELLADMISYLNRHKAKN
jgi:hypothetical protein